MYNVMKNLISKKYYATKEEVVDKLSVFFAYNVITEEQYTELMELTNQMYDENTDKSEEVTTE